MKKNAFIIAILNSKGGGSSKTTNAINLCYAFKSMDKNVLLLDSDSDQQSSYKWYERSLKKNLSPIDINTLLIKEKTKETLASEIKKYQSLYDIIIIDGVSIINKMLTDAIKVADLIAIPFEPSCLMIETMGTMVNLIKDRQQVTPNKPKAFFFVSNIINCGKKGTRLSRQANVVKGYGFDLLNTTIYMRQKFKESIGDGVTIFQTDDQKGKNEIMNLAKEILHHAT